MKADLRYYYVGDLTPEMKVTANIESVDLEHREASVRAPNGPVQEFAWNRLLMTPEDARELATMLLKAADHVEDLNKKR